MRCHEFYEYAERLMEGEPHGEAAAHLEACPRCQGLIGELQAIRAAARELEAEVEPPAHLWTAVRARLESEGLLRRPTRADWFAGLFHPRQRPALAGVYLGVLLVAAVMLSTQSGHRYEQSRRLEAAPPEIDLLQSQLAGGGRTVAAMHDHDPRVAASYRENLQIVDNVIRECEKRMRQEPEDEIAREYLYGAYQQKAELLATILERGATGE